MLMRHSYLTTYKFMKTQIHQYNTKTIVDGNFPYISGFKKHSKISINFRNNKKYRFFATKINTEIESIFVLGGGYQDDGTLPESVKRRLDLSIKIKKKCNNNCPIICIGGGTPHKKPLLDINGHIIHESTLCANYLIECGIDSKEILKETSSYDTVGNAFFALVVHAIPTQKTKFAVVTSQFHMPRSRAIFKHLFYNLIENEIPKKYELYFYAASDKGIFDDDILKARKEKEKESSKIWRKNKSKFKNLAEFHTWLFETHLCYAVSRQHEYGKLDDINDIIKKTY